MPTFIACFIAGICLAGIVTIWFWSAYKELASKRFGLADLENQLHLHEQLACGAGEGPEARTAEGMVKTSLMLCREAAKSYNLILRKPMNRIPALLMGFRPAEKSILQKGGKNK